MDIFDSKHILFGTLGSWLTYTKNAVTWLLKGVFGVIYAVVMGFVSAMYKLMLFLAEKIRRWPLFSFMLLAVVMTIVMVVNFVNMSIRAKTYEYERDSISYELYIIKHTYGLDTIGDR